MLKVFRKQEGYQVVDTLTNVIEFNGTKEECLAYIELTEPVVEEEEEISGN